MPLGKIVEDTEEFCMVMAAEMLVISSNSSLNWFPELIEAQFMAYLGLQFCY